MLWLAFLHRSSSNRDDEEPKSDHQESPSQNRAVEPASLEAPVGPNEEEIRPDADVARDDDEDDDHDTVISRGTTFSTVDSTSSVEPPQWYLRLRRFFSPPPQQVDDHECIPNFRFIPILSGIIIPFSILLEIPGLTEPWYIKSSNGQGAQTQLNTILLDIAISFSLVFAILANLCLVARFLEKRVKSTTLACIFLLTVHDTLNVITVLIFGLEHRAVDGFTYGHAFWMIICSTIASSFTNITLIIDFLWTPDFAKSGSGLTRKQRSLVIMVIILLCYIAFGAFVQVYLIDLSFLNSLYFTVVTIETVGFGDITPKTPAARAFDCVYATFGVINIALAVVLARETILEALEQGYRTRIRKVRMRRKELRRQARAQARWRHAVEWRLKGANQPLWVRDDVPSQTKVLRWLHDTRAKLMGHRRHAYFGSNPLGMHMNLEALTNVQLESAALEAGVPLLTLLPPGFLARRKEARRNSQYHEKGGAMEDESVRPCAEVSADLPLTYVRLGRMAAMLGSVASAIYQSGSPDRDVSPQLSPRQMTKSSSEPAYDRRDRLESFKAEIEREDKRAFFASLMVAWSLFIVFWIVGTVLFHVTEGWPFGATMYFCVMTFLTIGYGDYAPSTPAGRSIFIFWALFGIATMTILISIVSEAYTYRYKTILRSGPFQKAVKRYRAEKSQRRPPPEQNPFVLGNATDDSISPSDDPSTSQDRSSPDPFLRKRKETQAQLEALPGLILHHAHTFREHVQYFVRKRNHDAVPDGVRALVDDIAATEKLGERVKVEVLQDDECRHTLLTLGIEEELGKIVRIAEDALGSLNERTQLEALYYERND